jgi:glycosyltransferase involved in cell wall biosynthesis
MAGRKSEDLMVEYFAPLNPLPRTNTWGFRYRLLIHLSINPAVPFISVIITAHDRTQYLRNAVRSAMIQTLPKNEYEILVVKNFRGGIGETSNQVRIREVLVDSTPSGTKVCEGVKEAEGEIVSFLDDDDLFLSRKLMKVKEVFAAHENLGYFKNSFLTWDGRGFHHSPSPRERSEELYVYNDQKRSKFYDLFKWRAYVNSSSISVRKEVLKRGLDVLKRVNLIVDVFYFYLSLVSQCDILVSPEVLSLYRIHGANASIQVGSSWGQLAQRRIDFLKNHLLDIRTIREMIDEPPYSRQLDLDVSIDRITLAALPMSGVKAHFSDYLDWYRLYAGNWRGRIAGLVAFMPQFVKRKYAERAYRQRANM